MSKAPVDIIKYVIHAEAEATGLVEKPDLIGAIFGQTEGLLGEDLDLRELQKSGRIGRIDAELKTKGGITTALVTIPSSLDMVETSIIAAGIETITRVGPCDAKFKIKNIEDVREDKRKAVVSRARELLKTFMSDELPDSKEISEELREDIRTDNITKVEGLDAGPAVKTGDSIIIVEGRADVLNLLRNGIKNAVAVGGIKIPKEIVRVAKGKEATAFVDGDRGGDLILKSLKNAGVQISFVARAPAGREVEGLARKEIIMALRRKKAFESEDDAPEKDSRSKASPGRRSSSSAGDSDARGRRSPAGRERRSPAGREKRPQREARDGRDRPGRESRNFRSRDSRSRDSRSRASSYREEQAASTEADKLLGILSTLKNEAILLDDKFEEMERVKLDILKKSKALKKANALVIDDIITNDVLEMAKACKYIAGITTAGDLKAPEDKKIVTKF